MPLRSRNVSAPQHHSDRKLAVQAIRSRREGGSSTPIDELTIIHDLKFEILQDETCASFPLLAMWDRVRQAEDIIAEVFGYYAN